MEKYSVLGIMSGSSLDGVDLAFCEFEPDSMGSWSYTITKAETVPYNEKWKKVLKELPFNNAVNLVKFDIEYGKKLAEIAGRFLSVHNLKPDFLSSHGHTIFHNPEEGYTFQLGDGQTLAAASGFQVICDFRTKDVQLGGQGAPLVPIGDQLLFSEYDACLNIGGIANISFQDKDVRIAFDVCPANQMLNHLANMNGFTFDENGNMANSGEVKQKLFNLLNNVSYYQKSFPKSLGNENIRNQFLPLPDNFKTSVENKLATATEHIAFQISSSIVHLPKGKILVTGGGAHNKYLIKRLKRLTKHDIDIPEKLVIDFKEAMIFGFMGVLRVRKEMNCLASVTGASTDSSSGAIYYP